MRSGWLVHNHKQSGWLVNNHKQSEGSSYHKQTTHARVIVCMLSTIVNCDQLSTTVNCDQLDHIYLLTTYALRNYPSLECVAFPQITQIAVCCTLGMRRIPQMCTFGIVAADPKRAAFQQPQG
jgi:hypothetical protein